MFERSLRRAIVAAALLAFVAGCSASTGSVTPGQSSSSPSVLVGMRAIRGAAVERPLLVPSVPHPWSLPHEWPMKKSQVLFVADPQNNQILMYDPKVPNPTPEGSITNGLDYPFGIAVDKSGTLYAANLLGNGSTGSVTIYPKGSSSPSMTITAGCAAPYGIGVDSKGNVFIANLNNDTIVGYKAGASTPFETISFSVYGQALGVAVDAKDNVWIASDSTNNAYEIPAGSSTPQNSGLTGLNGPIGIAFGKKDEIYVGDFGSTNVQVYAYGTTTPERTIRSGLTAPTFNGLTKSDYFFQSNQDGNVVGYKKGQSTPFSTITGIADPRGIASLPLVKK